MTCPSCGAQLPSSGTQCLGCRADVGWRIRRPEGGTYGPYDLATVRRCITESRVAAGDLVQVGSGADWVPLEKVLPDAFGAEATEPSVLPPPAPAVYEAPSQPRPRAVGATPWVVCGVVALGLLLLFALLAAITYPASLRSRRVGRLTACQSNLKQISLGILMYVQDYDEKFPRAGDWQAFIDPYIKNRSVYSCPAAPGEPGYAYNHKLDGLGLADLTRPTTTYMGWDAGASPPGVTPLPGATANRHNGGDVFAFTDGHVKWIGGSRVPTAGTVKP